MKCRRQNLWIACRLFQILGGALYPQETWEERLVVTCERQISPI
jgi:hypothetical protein